MDENLIAPCGMNCGVCSGYLAMKYDTKAQGVKIGYCAGCRPRDKQCAFIKKRCDLIKSGEVNFCHECDDFPCGYLKPLAKRYSNLYGMSMVENLEYLKEHGMPALLQREEEKWKCPECGGVICCHNGICFSCGVEKLKQKKKIYRWSDDE